MLSPQLFDVNEAWIAFRLNDEVIQIDVDGAFHCMALMDAASCFILTMELHPATSEEPDRRTCRQLLMSAKSHKQQLPRILFIPQETTADNLTREATRHEIEIIRVPESDLLIFIREARQFFSEQFS